MKYAKNLLRALLVLVWILAVITIVSNRWEIADWWKVRGYTAPASIEKLADDTTMTGKARRIFYASDPKIEDKSSFNKNMCARENVSSLVLGCYEPSRGISVLKVDDPRLDGEMEVTAAHEMLHAAYRRMTSSEKQRINQLVETQLTRITDERIQKLVDSYRKTEPRDLDNEMHSIFGTEVRSLIPDLEKHYKTYFESRERVVAFSERYQQVFVGIQAKVRSYDARLEDMKVRIDAQKAQMATQESGLEALRADLDSKRASGNISAYNAGVAPYNAKVSQYNALVASTASLVDEYNVLIEERNKIALEQRELVQALDSKSELQTPR